MNQSRVSLFPHHQFDFGDAVVATVTCEGGTIAGILHENNVWYYRIQGRLRPSSRDWWIETQLAAACPHCLKQWQSTATCQHCGFDPDTWT